MAVGRPIRLGTRGALAVVLALLPVLVLGAGAAQAAPKGVLNVFGSAGSGPGEFQTAAGVAVNETTGAVYVVDVDNQRVQVFDVDGGFASAFGSGGAGNGEFAFRPFTPTGVAVDQSDGSVYVADTDNNRVQKLTAAGAYVSQFGAAGTGDGEMSGPQGVAVDPVSGDVYVLDVGNSRVQRFDDTGAYLSQFGIAGGGDGEFTSPSSIAIDSAGNVYVVDQGPFFSGRVQKFDTTGAFVEQVAPGVLTNSPHQVAADSTTGHVLVSQFAPDFSQLEVVELDAAGAVVDTHTSPGFATGLASNPASGAIYLADGFSNRVFILGIVNPSDAATAAATDVEAHGATLNGTVDPNGSPTQYHFEYSVDGSDWTIVPDSAVAVGNGDDPVAVSQPTGPLEANTEYRYRIVATKTYGGAPPTTSGETTFTTQAAPPSVTAIGATPTTNGATLRGRINPQNSPTTYRFEYGTTTAYGTAVPVPDGDAGAGSDPTQVSEQIAGLEPETTYHYRLVATNQAGTANGPDRTFTTPAADLPDPPAGRGYELVSPPDKNGGNILDYNARVAPDGNGVAFASGSTFGDAQAAHNRTSYVAARGSGGWATRSIVPRASIEAGNVSAQHMGISEDLSRSVVKVPELSSGAGMLPPLDPSAPTSCPPATPTLCTNGYLRDNATGELALLTPVASVGGFLSNTPAGGSADFGHVVFENDGVQAPGTPPGGGSKLYEWDHGVIRNVGIDPSGNPFTGTVTAGLTPVNLSANRWQSEPISADGSRIFFTVAPSDAAGSSGQIYLREDAVATYHVTRSEKAVPDAPSEATYLASSRDGSRAFFTTDEQLLDEDTNSACDLYMYAHSADPDADSNLTLVSRDRESSDGDAAGVGGPQTSTGCASGDGGLAGIDDAGSRAYFVTPEQVVEGEPTSSAPKLFRWDFDGGSPSTTYVAALSADDSANWRVADQQRLPIHQIAADGRHAVILTGEQLAPSEDADTSDDLYLYSADEDVLDCVSCQPPGVASAGDASVRTSSQVTGFRIGDFLVPSRVMSDDGGRVFFETRDSLAPGRDSNGRIDVYLWERGEVRLISDGQSGTDSRLLGATPSGNDVFFLTRSRLVEADIDNNIDLYDARVDGGFEEGDVPPECGLDCQGEPGAPPKLADPGSDLAGATGDLAPRPRPAFVVRAISARQRALLARTGRGGLRVRVNRAGRVSLTARIRQGGRSRVVARSSAVARGRGVVTVRLRLSPMARNRLSRTGGLRVRIAVRFSGARESRALTLNLRRATVSTTRKAR
jgi:DNA-binding beta-propeller fold protein YncE